MASLGGLCGYWRYWVVSSLVFLLLPMLFFFSVGIYCEAEMGIGRLVVPDEAGDMTAMRKLLGVDRIGDSCSPSAIALYQGATSPLPNGIPTYTVQILNVCISGCTVSNIHVSCGWFSSARMINPRIFRRMRYNDCLVNDGGPLAPGGSLSFEYANTFRYPLSVTDLRCY
ncbi:hypothetical protein MRB53_011601 [Persea americana]|uniref:Uncharacterized protein n=1 Tax=Persea americana TaxID=3435 RepID=A0ACC2LWC4_PERAE|nr:hypothetical protein MRB53_011601 [Persea americana]